LETDLGLSRKIDSTYTTNEKGEEWTHYRVIEIVEDFRNLYKSSSAVLDHIEV
jgi:hypothetical protein